MGFSLSSRLFFCAHGPWGASPQGPINRPPPALRGLETLLRFNIGAYLFFTKGQPTKEVWFYDLRTNMPSFGKTTPLKKEHFEGFVKVYTAEDRHAVDDERFSVFTDFRASDRSSAFQRMRTAERRI